MAFQHPETQEEYDAIEDWEWEDGYEEWLTDLYGEIKFGIHSFEAGAIVREMDPLGFDVGVSDWQDVVLSEVEENGGNE